MDDNDTTRFLFSVGSLSVETKEGVLWMLTVEHKEKRSPQIELGI